MENTQPDNIYEKITSIQVALLRYKHNGKKITVQVKIAVDENDSLHCVVSDDHSGEHLLNKNVTLVQKDQENLMYIGGHITKEVQTNKLVLSVNMTKACWFIRKSKGSVSWLQEKCVYLPEMKMAS